MPTLDVPEKYLALAPVIVTSPAPRCGTTLVQRLLSVSANGFIYGEEIGTQMKTLTNLLFTELQMQETWGEKFDAEFADALAGNLQKWRPQLSAPAAVMRKAWIETFYQLPFALDHHIAAAGRPIWGFKFPSYPSETVLAMQVMFPCAKVVYIYRNLPDVLRSAKARQFVTTPEQTAQFCADWAKNMAEASVLAQDQRVLFLKYEAFLEQPAEHIGLLELFTGVRGISADEMSVKINTFEGERSVGHSPSQYIEPAELTAADLEMIEQHAGEVMGSLYAAA